MPEQISTLEGNFLVAMPRMGDQRFENAVVFLCAHSNEGAMGFIVNQTATQPGPIEFWERLGIVSEKELANLPQTIGEAALHTGGPVEPGRGFVLHSPDYTSDTTLEINEEVSLTATIEILRDLALGRGPESFIVALGYSGWSSGQLEAEIADNGWLVCPADHQIIFSADNKGKYNRVMKSMGINPLLISSDSGHA